MLTVKSKFTALNMFSRIEDKHARLILAIGSIVMFVLAAGAPGVRGH
jgi:hypothetical protein